MSFFDQDYKRIYSIWKGMVERCNNPENGSYKRYGARGIFIDPNWLDFNNFYEWSLKNGYSSEYSIDRIDNNGPYSSFNCQWTTSKVQSNNKRNNIYITYQNKTQTLSQWCEELNLNYNTIQIRIKNLGWDPIKAITTPIAKKKGKIKKTFSKKTYTTEQETIKEDGVTKYKYKDKFYSIKELSILFNINYEKLRDRISNQNLPIDIAVEVDHLNTTYYEINGVSKTLREWCEETGMKLGTAKERIRKGIPVELAIDPTLNSSNGRALLDAVKQYEKDHPEYKRDHKTGSAFLITCDGETKLASEWAKEKGMDTYIVRNRYKNGYPTELCINPNLQSKDGRALLDAYNEYLKEHPDYDKEKEKELRSHK